MRKSVLFTVLLTLVVSGCGDSARVDNTTPSTNVDSSSPQSDVEDEPHADFEEDALPDSLDNELECDITVSIVGAMAGDFEGFATEEEAVNAWKPGTGDIPDGEWVQHEDNSWTLVADNGLTVAKAEVRAITGNENTTFATERYVSDGIEYCE